jgi:hypothetical protein
MTEFLHLQFSIFSINTTRPRLEIGILIIGYEVRTEECRTITEIISSKD